MGAIAGFFNSTINMRIHFGPKIVYATGFRLNSPQHDHHRFLESFPLNPIQTPLIPVTPFSPILLLPETYQVG